jgi:hypothetical protein
MKRFLLILSLLILPSFCFAADTLQDEYNDAADAGGDASLNGAALYVGQGFISSPSYTPAYIKVLLYRTGSGGDSIDAYIYSTHDADVPDSSICSGNFSATSTVTTNTNGDWYQIDLTSCPALTDATLYAVVLHQNGGDANNKMVWKGDSNAAYGGGMLYSTNSGNSWTKYFPWTMDFEVWSSAEEEPPPAAVVVGSFTFPQLLLVIFAVFLLCLLIDWGGDKIVFMINHFYNYKIR